MDRRKAKHWKTAERAVLTIERISPWVVDVWGHRDAKDPLQLKRARGRVVECIRGAYLLGTTLLANAPAMKSDKDKEEPSSRSKYPSGHDVYGATSFVVTRCTASKPLIASVRRIVGRASTCSLLSQELDAVDENQMDRIAQGQMQAIRDIRSGR